MSVLDWFSGRVFKFVHGNNLVYNTCWEDPRLDRVALQIGPSDNILVITLGRLQRARLCLYASPTTSRGRHEPAAECPARAEEGGHQVAGVRRLLPHVRRRSVAGRARGVSTRTAGQLVEWSQAYWDKYIRFFDSKRTPFYFRGTSGAFAKWMKIYTDHVDPRPPASRCGAQRQIARRTAVHLRGAAQGKILDRA